jgi:lipopolysaccharide export system permease protein
MRGVTFYERDDAGMIVRQLRAPLARYCCALAGDSRPRGCSRSDPAQVSELAEPVVDCARHHARPDRAQAGRSRHRGDRPAVAIRSRRSTRPGRRTAELKGKWWHKISGPLSAILMPLLGAVAGIRPRRSGTCSRARSSAWRSASRSSWSTTQRWPWADSAATRRCWPPWAPFVLFFLVGETVLIRSEE